MSDQQGIIPLPEGTHGSWLIQTERQTERKTDRESYSAKMVSWGPVDRETVRQLLEGTYRSQLIKTGRLNTLLSIL